MICRKSLLPILRLIWEYNILYNSRDVDLKDFTPAKMKVHTALMIALERQREVALSAWSIENVPGQPSSTMRALWALENIQCLLYIVLEPSALLFNLLLFVVFFSIALKSLF